jgi:hypothetical protein
MRNLPVNTCPALRPWVVPSDQPGVAHPGGEREYCALPGSCPDGPFGRLPRAQQQWFEVRKKQRTILVVENLGQNLRSVAQNRPISRPAKHLD